MAYRHYLAVVSSCSAIFIGICTALVLAMSLVSSATDSPLVIDTMDYVFIVGFSAVVTAVPGLLIALLVRRKALHA